MRRFFQHIRGRTLAIFVMAGLLPIVALALVVYNLARQDTLNNVGELHWRNTQSIYDTFIQRVQLIDNRTQIAVWDNTFVQSLQLQIEDPYIQHFDSLFFMRGALADVIVSDSRLVDSVYVWSSRGEWLLGSNLLKSFHNEDFSTSDWYAISQEEGSRGGQFVLSRPLDGGGPMWSKYYYIKSRGNPTPSIASLNLSLLNVDENFRTALQSTTSYVLFTDDEVLCGRYDDASLDLAALQALQEKQEAGAAPFLMEHIGGRQHILSFVRSEYLGATLALLDPYPLAVQSGSSFVSLLPLLVGTAMLMAVVILMVSAYHMTKPIKTMLGAMRKVEEADLTGRIPTTGSDYYYELYNGFNTMADRMEGMMAETRQHYEERQRLEYAAMRSQINAHFLYNTLDVIHWMATAHGAELIGDITQWLSDYYRSSLSHGRDAIELSRVEAMLEAYLQVSQLKGDKPISFSCDIPEYLRSTLVLKYIFQPLAENSLQHGFGEDQREMSLQMQVRRKGEDLLEILMMDDGGGLSQEAIDALNKGLSSPEAPGGFALWHVNRHIKMYYGPQYGLEVFSNYPRGLTVRICIPCEVPRREEEDSNGEASDRR